MSDETRAISQADVDAKAKVGNLRMTEGDFQSINPDGHQRQYRADGSYTWTNDWEPNDGTGKLTRTADAVNDGMGAFVRADNERFGALQEKVERSSLRDADGNVHFVEAGRADDCA